MIESRRWPSATPGALHDPSPSGPRWRSKLVMVVTVSTLAREPMIPAIPHMAEVYATRRGPARVAETAPAVCDGDGSHLSAVRLGWRRARGPHADTRR